VVSGTIEQRSGSDAGKQTRLAGGMESADATRRTRNRMAIAPQCHD